MSLGDGSTIGSTTLSEASTSAIDLITGFTGTFANNIGFWLLIAVVVATLWGIKCLIKKYTNIHSNINSTEYTRSLNYYLGYRAKGYSSMKSAEFAYLDEYGPNRLQRTRETLRKADKYRSKKKI